MNATLPLVSPFSGWLFSFFDEGAPIWLAVLVSTAVYWMIVLAPVLLILQRVERKLTADMQMRIGPNRTGPYGILQQLADAIKLLSKEDVRSNPHAGLSFVAGPLTAFLFVFAALGAVPMSNAWMLSDGESGVFFIYVLLLASRLMLFWTTFSVRSQWSPVAALRMLSAGALYSLPLLLALLPPVIAGGTLSMKGIVSAQGGWFWRWNVFRDPGCFVGAFVMFGALHVWQARAPFDHVSAREEIGGGTFAETSGVMSGILILVERMSFLLVCSLLTAMYFGGGNTPFNLDYFGRGASFVEFLVFVVKTVGIALISIWIKGSVPRLKIDQLVNFVWKVLVPFGFAALIFSLTWTALSSGRSLLEVVWRA